MAAQEKGMGLSMRRWLYRRRGAAWISCRSPGAFPCPRKIHSGGATLVSPKHGQRGHVDPEGNHSAACSLGRGGVGAEVLGWLILAFDSATRP